jgi:rabenosyn-5
MFPLQVRLRPKSYFEHDIILLQALPKPQKASTPSPASDPVESIHPGVDPDSEVARKLQPLLEQEALLESFVEEAKAQRKFEDTQTLRANLNEIRAEIDSILANAEGALSETRPRSGNGTPRAR